MYEYTDFYDEAETGGIDGGEILFSRQKVIKILRQHGHSRPIDWFGFFKETNQLCKNIYPATTVLFWLNY